MDSTEVPSPEPLPSEEELAAAVAGEERWARWTVRAAGIGLVLALLAVIVTVLNQQASTGGRLSSPLLPASEKVVIGPEARTVVAAYVRDRRAALAALDPGEQRVAVVSFTRYRTPAEAAES